jgi:hypothetical protein
LCCVVATVAGRRRGHAASFMLPTTARPQPRARSQFSAIETLLLTAVVAFFAGVQLTFLALQSTSAPSTAEGGAFEPKRHDGLIVFYVVTDASDPQHHRNVAFFVQHAVLVRRESHCQITQGSAVRLSKRWLICA